MVKKGPRYTPAEAEARIPEVARRLALDAVDLMIALDKHPIDSHEVERRVFMVTGQAGFLARLCHRVWKSKGLEKAATGGVI